MMHVPHFRISSGSDLVFWSFSLTSTVSLTSENLTYHSHTLHVDASLTGLGGVWNNQVYANLIFDIYGMELKIVHFEMLNLLIGLKLWAHEWSHSV